MDPDPLQPIEVPLTDVIDLHSILPRDVKAAVEAYLEAANERGLRFVRIIHGRGIGVQREIVRGVLAKTPFVRSFGDAPAEVGGRGATLVELGEPPMDELESLAQQYDSTLAEMEHLVAGLTPDQFHWHPASDQWSVAQCVEHLAKTGSTYGEKIAFAVEVGTCEHVFANGPFAYGWMERLFLRITEPPPRFRVKAPRIFRPAATPAALSDPATTLDGYRKANRGLRELVLRSKGLDLKRLRVVSPAADWIKVSLGIALAIAVAHERRHIYQVKQILKAAGLGRN